MFPITSAKEGETLIIKKMMGKDDVKRHLETLGIVVGEKVAVISTLAGNIIMSVRGTRVALDKSIASHIMVTL